MNGVKIGKPTTIDKSNPSDITAEADNLWSSDRAGENVVHMSAGSNVAQCCSMNSDMLEWASGKMTSTGHRV